MYCLSSEMSILGEVNSRITPDLWKRNLISWNSMDFSSYIVYSWLLLTCAFTHKLSLDMLNNLESILCYGLYAVDHPVTFCMSWWAWKKKKKGAVLLHPKPNICSFCETIFVFLQNKCFLTVYGAAYLPSLFPFGLATS